MIIAAVSDVWARVRCIDLVLFRRAQDFSALGVSLLGNTPGDKVFNGAALIWPSYRAGVWACLRIRD